MMDEIKHIWASLSVWKRMVTIYLISGPPSVAYAIASNAPDWGFMWSYVVVWSVACFEVITTKARRR